MTAAAVIIGVDAYVDQPLTSAVHDALAVRDELIALGLVKESEVRLLTAPSVEGSELADSSNIDRMLHAIYDDGAALDRLFVFFAGHGLMAPIDPARGTFQTAVVPADVRDLRMDSRLLFNVDDLVDRLSLGGPKEQFFFIDACRDLAFGENPGNLLPLSWPMSRNPSGSANAQAILFAVSPMGTARSTRGGLGEMTSHLIQALRGAGRALDWSDQDDCHVITATSVARYVIARISEMVADEPQWQQTFRLPELRPSGPELTPIRLIAEPPVRTLTLNFDPIDAAAATTVRLRQRGNMLESPAWPPHGPGEAVTIAPFVYRFDVTSRLGEATADPMRVDAREQAAAVIRVGAPPAPRLGSIGPGPAAVQDLPPMRGIDGGGDTALIRASTQEPEAVIEVDGLEPPYRSMQAVHAMEQEVPPGTYRIRFRLGDEVFSETVVDLVAGDDKLVRPSVAASPLVFEALQTGNEETVEILESIGPVQANVLPTMLALLGVKPFDKTRAIRGRIEGLVQPREFTDFGERPLSVLVAIEGNRWEADIESIARSIECEVVTTGGTRVRVPIAQLQPGVTGWARVSYGCVAAPGASFFVRIASSITGRVDCAAASLPGRVTVIAMIFRPDGGLSSAQHILRLPGRKYDEPVVSVPYGRMVRQLTLGQRLYESGELLERAGGGSITPLWELLHAKWTDPLLGCMAYYAWADATAAKESDEARYLARETAQNLLRYFGELPDARVAAAHGLPERRVALIDGLLADDTVPVLARSCRELAKAALERGTETAAAVGWAARVRLNDHWTLRFEPASSLEEVLDGPAGAFQG